MAKKNQTPEKIKRTKQYQRLYDLNDDELKYLRYFNTPSERILFALYVLGMFISLWFVFPQSYMTLNITPQESVVVQTWALAFFVVFMVIVISNFIISMPQKQDKKWVNIRKELTTYIKSKEKSNP